MKTEKSLGFDQWRYEQEEKKYYQYVYLKKLKDKYNKFDDVNLNSLSKSNSFLFITLFKRDFIWFTF